MCAKSCHYRIHWPMARPKELRPYYAYPKVIDVEGGDGAVRHRGRGVKVYLDIVNLQVAASSHLQQSGGSVVSSSHRRSSRDPHILKH